MTGSTLRRRVLGLGVGVVALVLVCGLVAWLAASSPAYAQERPGKTPPARPKEVTLTGRVVDLHCYMSDKYSGEDRAKCTADCIKSGVPAGLETEAGLVILGQGAGGATKTLLPLAYQHIQARGRLYEKGGVRYLDVSSVQKAEETAEEEEGGTEDEPGD